MPPSPAGPSFVMPGLRTIVQPAAPASPYSDIVLTNLLWLHSERYCLMMRMAYKDIIEVEQTRYIFSNFSEGSRYELLALFTA